MMASTAQINKWADLVMADIKTDISEGVLPSTVASFVELHDFVDANEYLIDHGVNQLDEDLGSDVNADINRVTDVVTQRLAGGELAEPTSWEVTVENLNGSESISFGFNAIGEVGAITKALALNAAPTYWSITVQAELDASTGHTVQVQASSIAEALEKAQHRVATAVRAEFKRRARRPR